MLKGLRTRTVLLLLSLILLVAIAASWIGQQTLETLRHDLGSALVRDHARVAQQRIQGRIGLELALSQRLAASRLLHDWLRDETHPRRRADFLAEAEGFRQAFSSQSYFVATEKGRTFHHADAKHGGELRFGYRLQEKKPENAWYFTTLRQPAGYWINVDFDKTLGVTNVWINVAALDSASRPLGVVGTGIDLKAFLQEVLSTPEPGVTTMIVDHRGNIVAHPDTSRMQFDLAAATDGEKTIYRHLAPADADVLRRLLATPLTETEAPTLFAANLDGQPRLLAHATIPSLGWHVITALDTESGNILSSIHLSELLLAGGSLLVLLLVASTLGVDTLILRPLRHLTRSAHDIAAGNYGIRLASQRSDELGELTRTFDYMAAQVQAHSQNLEQLVTERTDALLTVHRKLTDSIQYARLIQTAILPDQALREDFPGEYFVLWQPRDVVGGDLYLYRRSAQGLLFGVIDCAGHGVPGACMTMIAHAALEMALAEGAWNDPAGVLVRMDSVIRRMLPQERSLNQLATSMDIGLCHIPYSYDQLIFAGAQVSLLWQDPQYGLQHCKGGKRALNDRKQGHYSNQSIRLQAGQTFYLTTDGLLDQAGGDAGYAFGHKRLAQWIAQQAGTPLEQQQASLQATLDAYRGEQPQRDDITMFAFRIHHPV